MVFQDSSPDQLAEYKNMQAQTYKWLRERKIKSFFSAVTAPSLRNGFQALLQACTHSILLDYILLILLFLRIYIRKHI